ncbi:hypothetical protein ACFWNL_17270 [Kitasatospora sp. NPDC058397]
MNDSPDSDQQARQSRPTGSEDVLKRAPGQPQLFSTTRHKQAGHDVVAA